MKQAFSRYTLIRPFPKGRGMKLRLIIFTLLALALSACGTTPTPELGRGVDDIGAYTVVARSGDETFSAQSTSQKLPARVLEVREYSGSRYRAVFRITFPSYTKEGLLDAKVSIGTDGRKINYNQRRLQGSDPKSYSVDSGAATFSAKSGTRVCGDAVGKWGARDSSGDYSYDDEASFTSSACFRR